MLHITVENGEQIAANLRKWPDHRSAYVGKHLQVLGTKVGEVMLGFMQRHRYTGEGEKSLSVVVNVGNGNEDYVEIGPEAEHWVYVRFGRQPGKWPPYEPLRRWCEFKFGDGSFATVHGVQKKIYEQGIEPDPFLEDTLKDNRTQDALQQTAEAIGKQLVGVIEGTEQ